MTAAAESGESGPAGRQAPGDARSRLHGSAFLIGFAATILVVLLAAAAAAALTAPPEPPPECEPGLECGGPPPVVTEPSAVPGETPTPGPSASAAPSPSPGAPSSGPVAIRAGTPWLSTDLGYEFEYNSGHWKVEREDGRGVAFVSRLGAQLDVRAVPANESGVQALFDARLAELRADIPDLAADPRPRNTILGPAIGYLDGIGGTFAGSGSNAQGGATPVGVSLIAASDGRTTVIITLAVDNPEKPINDSWWRQQAVRSTVNIVIKTFRWEVPR